MSSGTLIFLLLVIGLPLAMMFMHRGGLSHGMGGMGGYGHMGHGGHGQGGHGEGGQDDDGHRHGSEDGDDEKPVLGKPGQRTERQGQAGHGHC